MAITLEDALQAIENWRAENDALRAQLVAAERERDELRETMGELAGLLVAAEAVFPDAVYDDFGVCREDWNWCWDELYDESQDRVKTVRRRIDAALAKARATPGAKGE